MDRLDASVPLPPALRGGIVALGNFDGVHLGHQAVIGRAVERARAAGRPALVATFDPHPMRHFKPDAAPFRLTTLDQRQELFAGLGADAMLVFGFDQALAGMVATDFVAARLLDTLGVRGVVTGEDFTFGRGRGGNLELLVELGMRNGFSVEAVPAVEADGVPVSSSRIREALLAGHPEEAARLLTRPFAIRGVVQHGDKVGRTIGYPTANLELGTYLRPAYGIYAVRGRLPDGRMVDGAANLGVRPTFDPPKELLEPYFFDFSEDLYGQEIDVELHHFLRPEARFVSLEALQEQMAADCDAAQRRLA